ncbi:hypothetical protein LTR55_011547 [Exophiala xenobiotica]|nr:hypothetical protein LTR55_011547 [Exophiala xenobiotica]
MDVKIEFKQPSNRRIKEPFLGIVRMACSLIGRPEKREIYVRCLRGMAEMFDKLGRREEAVETMQQVVDICRYAFGPEHPFTNRARMHLKSISKRDVMSDAAIPAMVYRLGRGGSAAKYIWISRTARLYDQNSIPVSPHYMSDSSFAVDRPSCCIREVRHPPATQHFRTP